MERLRRRAATLLCAVAVAGFAGSASAKPAHKSAQRQGAAPAAVQNSELGGAHDSARSGQGAQLSARKPAESQATGRKGRRAHTNDAFGGFTSNSLVSEARKYLGTNPTGRGSLWCGAFMDLVLKRTGHPGGGNLASAYARYGSRVAGPQVGAIAVIRRGGGGHVGVVAGVDPNGNPIVISGNHNNTVAESVYPRSRIVAYVMPGS